MKKTTVGKSIYLKEKNPILNFMQNNTNTKFRLNYKQKYKKKREFPELEKHADAFIDTVTNIDENTLLEKDYKEHYPEYRDDVALMKDIMAKNLDEEKKYRSAKLQHYKPVNKHKEFELQNGEVMGPRRLGLKMNQFANKYRYQKSDVQFHFFY